MSLYLKICRDDWGTWSVHGLSPAPLFHFPSLSASIDYACKACEAAPATIELFVDGMYIVVYQERGWPRRLVASEADRARSGLARPGRSAQAPWSRRLAWLKGFGARVAKPHGQVAASAASPR